jgi:hypothetical protein
VGSLCETCSVKPDPTQPADAVAPGQSAEELRLWADYYEAAAHALELVRAGDIRPATLVQIVAENSRATIALERIRELRVDAP